MGGNFTAALILDANSTEEQRDALTNIISRQADAGHQPRSQFAAVPPGALEMMGEVRSCGWTMSRARARGCRRRHIEAGSSR